MVIYILHNILQFYIADNIDLKSGETSTIALWTLQKPYKTGGLDPTALIFLYCLPLRRS